MLVVSKCDIKIRFLDPTSKRSGIGLEICMFVKGSLVMLVLRQIHPDQVIISGR